MIYFLTGASGVGKTTIVEALERQYKDDERYKVFYFDSIGVPSVEEMIEKYGEADKWQEAKTNEWVEKLVKEPAEVIFMEGQSNLNFIKKAFGKQQFDDYQIILVDCDEDTMKRRLERRGQPDLFTQDMKNWLQFLRNQGEEVGARILNTSNKTVESVLEELLSE